MRRLNIIFFAIALTGLFALSATAENPKITIEGNLNYSARKIKNIFKLRLHNGQLESDSLEQGIYRLKSFYRRNGFVNSEVEYLIDSISAPGTVKIKLLIAEGDRYYVDMLNFKGNCDLPAEILSKAVVNKIRKPLNSEDLGQDDFNLMLLYADFGYIYAEVDHTLEFQNGHKAVITYNITEGEKVTISRINISGNHYLKDRFIIETVSISPGDIFSRRELIKSRYLLQSSDLFQEVEISPAEIDSVDNSIAVNINVAEKPRRLFETSIGYGSGDAVRLMAKWAHRNLFGMGRRFEYNGLVAFQPRFPLKIVRGRSQVSYEDPAFYFIKQPFRGEAYYDDLRPSYTDYRLETVGFNFSVSTPLSSTINIRYRWKQEWLKLSPNWQPTNYLSDTLSYKGRRSLAVISSYEKLDDPVNPQKGLSGDLELEYTGGIMGGSETYQKMVDSWTFYLRALARRIFLAGRLRYGAVGDWAEKSVIPGYEKFFLGGPSTVRGYAYNSIGPVDEYGRVIGGRIMALTNIQATLNLGHNWGLAAFIDGGMVSNKTFNKQSLGDMVSSPGWGIRYTLPFGTGRLDFAAPGTLMGQIKYWRWMIAWGEVF